MMEECLKTGKLSHKQKGIRQNLIAGEQNSLCSLC